MRKENFKSDLRLTVTLTLGGVPFGVPDHDFALRFYAGDTYRSYTCYRKGDEWVNCKAEGDKVLCMLDHHKLGTGVLWVEYYDFAPDADFADGNQLKVVPQSLGVELIEGPGDDATDIDVRVAIDIVGALADVRAALDRLNALLANLYCSEDGFFYVDLAGNIAFRYTPQDGFDAAKVSNHFIDLVLLRLVCRDDGFYYTDSDGNVAFRYTPEGGFDAAKVSEHLKSLVLSRLHIAEDGFYYTDLEGNVGMRYNSDGFDAAKLSDHFKSLLPAGGGSSFTELKMLCVGNSYTHDEISYLPYVLKQMFPDMSVKLGIAASGSATLSQWWTQRESAAIIGTPRWSGGVYVNSSGGFLYNPTRYVEWTSATGAWSNYDETRSLSSILESENWGIVTFQQESNNAANYSSIETHLSNLVSYVRGKVPNVKVGWLFTHVWNDKGAQSSAQCSSDGRWSSVKDVVKTVVDSHVVDFMIPNGTAVQNLRHTSANNLGSSSSANISSAYPSPGLTADSSHLQEGVAPLCAAMCTASTLTKAIPYVFLEYSSSWNVYGANGDPVGMTPEYESLACQCALDAVLSPYELTYDEETSSSEGLQGVADLTDVFATGDASAINTAIADAGASGKAVFVGPGDYPVNGGISVRVVDTFYCLGNIIGPQSEMSSIPVHSSGVKSAMRAVVVVNGSNRRCFIHKITVRHNYCGIHIAFAKRTRIEVEQIHGEYSTTLVKRCKSVFNNGNKDTVNSTGKLYDFYEPIPDSWILNSGVTADHLQISHLVIGSISNLNYGIYLIESRGDRHNDWVNMQDEGVYENTFDITSIVCKKAVVLDAENIITYDGNNNIIKRPLTDADTTYIRDRDIHGNIFNINGFDATDAPQTNSIETVNTDFYPNAESAKRVIFSIRGASAGNYRGMLLNNNIFNVNYCQGIYDVCVDAKNVSNQVFNIYLQPNDLYFCNSTSEAQRNWSGETPNKYYRGTTDNTSLGTSWEPVQDVYASPILIFDNCFSMQFNNLLRAFLRPSEISVINDSRDIFINQVYEDEALDLQYHVGGKEDIQHIQQRIYHGNLIYKKYFNDDYPMTPEEITSAINTICV